MLIPVPPFCSGTGWTRRNSAAKRLARQSFLTTTTCYVSAPAQFILADVADLRVYFRSADHHVCVDTPKGAAFDFMMMLAEMVMVPCAKQWCRVANTVRKDLAFALIIRPMH